MVWSVEEPVVRNLQKKLLNWWQDFIYEDYQESQDGYIHYIG